MRRVLNGMCSYAVKALLAEEDSRNVMHRERRVSERHCCPATHCEVDEMEPIQTGGTFQVH